MQTLEERVASLERKNRRLSQLLVGSIGVVLAIVVCGADPKHTDFDTIWAHEINVSPRFNDPRAPHISLTCIDGKANVSVTNVRGDSAMFRADEEGPWLSLISRPNNGQKTGPVAQLPFTPTIVEAVSI